MPLPPTGMRGLPTSFTAVVVVPVGGASATTGGAARRMAIAGKNSGESKVGCYGESTVFSSVNIYIYIYIFKKSEGTGN